MYKAEYERWLSADLEDADLKPELSKIQGNDEEIKDEDITNSSIEDILVKPKDETQIINREISLFDDEEE